MKKNNILKLVCALVGVLGVTAVIVFFIGKYNNRYDAIFCSMYSVANYKTKDIETYLGLKTYKPDEKATDLNEIGDYLDDFLNKRSQIAFLGLDTYKIWKDTEGNTEKWQKCLQENLLSYITENPDVTFQVVLSYPSINYWLSLGEKEVQEYLASYEKMVDSLSGYDNVICYFVGAKEWLITNPDSYTAELEINEFLSKQLLIYMFCERYFVTDADTIKGETQKLEELIKKEKNTKPAYPDLSDKQIVFFGDSIIASYSGTTSITGVMTAFTGCETYNYALAGTAATDSEDYDNAFCDVLDRFQAGTARVTQGDENFVRNEAKELCFVIHYGLNDFFYKSPIENTENLYDTKTYAGALRDGIQTLQNAYPKASIVIVAPYCYYTEDEWDNDLGEYVDVILSVADEMGIYCLNNYVGLGWNESNYQEYLRDGCHPNEMGCMVMAKRMIEAVNEATKENSLLTLSQLISMEMLEDVNISAVDSETIAEQATEESEYANFAIADVDNYVNVRNQPSTEGEIVGKIFDGAVAQVLAKAGENDEWFQIISGNVEGYIKAEFFIYGDDAAAVMDQYVTKYAQVKADRLNVRKEATTDSDRIGYIDNGEKVKLIEDLGDWLKVQYLENKEGYVSAEYVQILEEYTYAKTLEEEQAEIAARKALEQRQKVSENLVPESTNVQAPNTNYATNAELRTSIVNYALQYVGDKYVSGGTSLATGTDCSGFTCFVYADFGYSISRTPEGQYSGAGRAIDYSQIQPGDIICYSSNGGKSCTHVAMYIGDGQVVHAANSRKGVITSNADYEPIIGVRNVID